MYRSTLAGRRILGVLFMTRFQRGVDTPAQGARSLTRAGITGMVAVPLVGLAGLGGGRRSQRGPLGGAGPRGRARIAEPPARQVNGRAALLPAAGAGG
ncbi:hypothetical protein ACIBG8_42340 [Nonomuraea sp. NPDC050556]|uniref:hypothetical protein n=1 Tax=Nonomuraea sp. NPDC050556 TaxID=3364369 RepID=UPI00378DB645